MPHSQNDDMGGMPPMPPMEGPDMGAPDGMNEPDMGAPDNVGGPDEMNGDSEGGAGGDVKKYSGELSQALNSYNEENPSDEEKINKYAINMIAAQVADYLSDKDKRSVIKKLQGNEDDMSSDEQPQNDGTPQDEAQGMPPMDENRIVQEIVNDIIDGRHTKRSERRITNDEVSDDNPFRFK